MEDRRSKMLKRVQDLLSRAASTDFAPEAESCRDKANELMMRYSIEEFELVQQGQDRPKPVFRKVGASWMVAYDLPYEVRSSLYQIFHACAQYSRTMVAPSGTAGWDGDEYKLGIVGTEADIDYLELMFTSLYMECVMRMAPSVNKNRPMIENLVALKEVGHKWAYIGEELYRIGQLDQPYTRNTGVRFTKLYSDYCKKHGRDQVKISPEVFKRSFINGFTYGVRAKLQEMMEANDRQFETEGAGIVLRDMRHDVAEFFAAMFPPPPPVKVDPNAKLKPVKYKQRFVTVDSRASARGYSSGSEAAVVGRPGEGVKGGSRKELK
jgi:uncharacterized protein DUF2786